MTHEHPIIGHEKQRAQLLHDVASGSLTHAYLFAGKRHLGKFTIARWFAEHILADSCKNEAEKASHSMLIRKNTHPDVLTLDALWIEDVCTDWNMIGRSSSAPQQHRAKAKIKTDTIGIDDVRALQERLYETPQGTHTLCLIRSIERLHITAANALLKILEEPPPKVLFCFTTESLSSIPATIVSRMRVLNFSPLARNVLGPLVAALPAEDRELLLGIAQGAPGIIIRCLEDEERLRAEKQAGINAHRFLQTPSILERFREMLTVMEEEESSALFLRQLFLKLSKDLRGTGSEAQGAACSARHFFSILSILRSNTHRPLLAAHAALSSL